MRYACIALLVIGCSSTPDALPPPEMALLTGHEVDNWLLDPPAKTIKVELVQTTDGSRSVLAEGAAPAAVKVEEGTRAPTITLPEQHYTDAMVASFEASGISETGETVMRGVTVPFTLYALSAVRVPLFLGRVGRWARPPLALTRPHVHPVVAVAGHEYVIAAGGDPYPGSDLSMPDFYDAAFWQVLMNQPPLPRAPASMALVGVLGTDDTVHPELLMVNNDGATWLDLATDATNMIEAIPGLTSDQISGGDTIVLPDGKYRYIIGATRATGAPTTKVLRIDNKANLVAMELKTARLGAAAAVVGTTLVVVGGSDSGPMAEVLNSDQNAFVPLTLPPDPTVGLGLAAFDATTAVVGGGKDPITKAPSPLRTFDITCTSSCTTTELSTLPMTLTRTKLFAFGANKLLVLGESDDGENHSFWVDTTSAPPWPEKPLREPRKGATPFVLPNGQIALLGGTHIDVGTDGTRTDTGTAVLTIESFVP